LKGVNDQLNQENESLQNEKQALRKRVDDLEWRLRESRSDSAHLRSKIASETQETIDQLNADKTTLSDRLTISEAKAKESQDDIAELRELVNTLQQEAKAAQQHSQELENQVYELEGQRSAFESSIHTLQLQNQGQNELLLQLREERNSLQEQLENLQQRSVVEQLEQESAFNEKFESLRSQFQEKQSTNSMSDQQRWTKSETEKQELMRELRQARNAGAALGAKCRADAERVESLNKEQELLLRENQDLKENMVGQVQSLNQLELQYKQLSKDRTLLQDEIRQLTAQNNELKQGQAELVSAKTRLDEMGRAVQRLQLKVDSITEVNERITDELTEAREARDKAERGVEQITETVRQIHHLLRPAADGKSDDRPAVGQFLKELSTLRDLVLGSHSAIESLIRERNQLSGEVSNLQMSGLRVAQAEEEARIEVAGLTSKIDSMERDMRSIAESQKHYGLERERLSAAISRLTKALHATKGSLQASEREKQQLKEQKLQLRLLLEEIRDIHHLSIDIPH
jgi:chromosome segregation ATPase